MPDSDRFERKLFGKGWRSVYRIACSSAPVEAIVDKIVGAAAHLFRTEDTRVIRDIYRELRDADDLRNATRLRESVSQQAFDQLASSAAALKLDAGHSEMARFGERAALRTFNEIEKAETRLSEDVLKQQFTRNLVWELTERRCFGVARDGITEATGRDRESQLGLETKIRGVLTEPCATLSKNLLADEGSRLVRAPKRLLKSKPTTIDTLTAPLRVLGESQ